MGKPVKRETKKPYAKPTLTVYGTVRELTQKVGAIGTKDGGILLSKSKTSFG
jgi:hypothetical protein